MRILITGGAGFLGAWLGRRMRSRGWDVRVFDRDDGDVSDLAQVADAAEGCDAIAHLAALLTPACQADPVRGAHVNLIGTLAVFEAARRHGIRHIAYASSAGVFGPDDGETPFPMTLYGAFKLACEGCARAYFADHGIPSVGFRPLVVYGPGREVGSSAGPSIACARAARNEPYVIPFTGTTDMIFVDDVAAAFEAAVTREVNGAHVFNLRGEVATVEEIIATIARLQPGAQLSASGATLPIKPELTVHDPTPILGPLPHTSLAEGIARTLAHYRAALPTG